MNLRPAPNVRHAQIHHGDSLQRVSLRELGDASRWVELVVLNELRPPYIAEGDKPGPGLLAPGDWIKIPAPGSGVSAELDAEAVLGADLLVEGGRLQAEDGDIALVSGVRNLSQALRHRVVVEKQELGFHPEFGCWVRSLLGDIGGARSARLAAFYVKSALSEDPRVQSIPSCVAELDGDRVLVRATVIPISGQPADLTVVV